MTEPPLCVGRRVSSHANHTKWQAARLSSSPAKAGVQSGPPPSRRNTLREKGPSLRGASRTMTLREIVVGLHLLQPAHGAFELEAAVAGLVQPVRFGIGRRQQL